MILSPRSRKLALSVHIAASVGWVGAIVAYLPLDVTAATSGDAQLLRAAYLGMDLLARWAIVPLAIVAFLTGLLVSLGTSWGLFRHYWVVVSLALTAVALVVLLVETRTIASLAHAAADPARTADELRALGNTLPHSIGGLVVLLIVLALNVYKPRGLTRYGWRKQKAEATSADAADR